MDTQLKRGILEVCVLAELCRGQSYGYRIQKDLAQYVTLSESALYHILKLPAWSTKAGSAGCIPSRKRAGRG